MDLAVSRERNQPIFIGTETANGAQVHFRLTRERHLDFATAQGESLLAFGIPVMASGSVRLASGFAVQPQSISAIIRPVPSETSGRRSAFHEGDRDRALSQAVERAVCDAAARLVDRNLAAVAGAWLTLADDYVLERMEYRQYNVDKIAQLGEGISWDTEQFHREQIDRAEREASSLDEEAYAHSWLHATRPGYVVICDGKPADKGETRFKQDNGTGWVQRHVFIHLSAAHRFAQEMAREDVAVQRIRIVEGLPYVVAKPGLVEPEWSLDEPVLTGTLMPGGR